MRYLLPVLLAVVSVALAGREAIATVFEADVWVGVIIVLVILGIIGFIVSRFRGSVRLALGRGAIRDGLVFVFCFPVIRFLELFAQRDREVDVPLEGGADAGVQIVWPSL
jgi:hypothetical protein